jgi:hypothetical protein
VPPLTVAVEVKVPLIVAPAMVGVLIVGLTKVPPVNVALVAVNAPVTVPLE